jgi:hypothetical protein
MSTTTKLSGYPIAMTKKGLLELKDPANRDHPALRWGQAVVIKFCGNSYPSWKTAQDLFFANDDKAETIINQFILDYNL